MNNDKRKSSRKTRKSPRRVSPEIRVVRVISRPGPDVEDRMRRLLALMFKYATQDGYSTRGKDAPSDDRNADDPTQAGA